MAKSIIGTQASIGPDLATPSRSLPQPHWNTATITPYAAPIESRFITTALSGTSTLRNTSISSRNDNTSTSADEDGEPLVGVVRVVGGGGDEPAHLHVDVGPVGHTRDDVVAQRVDEVGRLLRLR